MTTIEALNIIELARWHLSDKEKDAIETIKALAMETEEMREQMAAQDEKLEELYRLSRRGTSDKMPFNPEGAE